VLIASLAGLGYRQGVVRVAFSLVGIIVGALLAVPLSKPIKPVLMAVGVKNPTLVWALAPLIVFLIISILFKLAAFAVHHKIDVYFKYKAGDLRLRALGAVESSFGFMPRHLQRGSLSDLDFLYHLPAELLDRANGG